MYVKIVKAKFNSEVVGGGQDPEKFEPQVIMSFEDKDYMTNSLDRGGLEPVWNKVFKLTVKKQSE